MIDIVSKELTLTLDISSSLPAMQDLHSELLMITYERMRD